MPFTPKTWVENDPITPAELNRIENGIFEASFVGRVTAAGADVVLPTGFGGTSRSSVGVYVITHNFGSTNYVVTATPIAAGDGLVAAMVVSVGVNSVTLDFRTATDALVDIAFMYAIFRHGL